METDEQKRQDDQQPPMPIGLPMWPVQPHPSIAASLPGQPTTTPMPGVGGGQPNGFSAALNNRTAVAPPEAATMPRTPAATPGQSIRTAGASGSTAEGGVQTHQPPAIALPPQQKPAIQTLWDKTADIHNPFAKFLARAGTGALTGLEAAGESAFPSVAMMIPHSILNTKVENRHAEKRAEKEHAMGVESSRAESEETRAKTEADREARLEQPDNPLDKKLDEYTNEHGQRVLTFQRADGSVYDRVGGKAQEKGDRGETPFTVWRQQHPSDDVSEYFKLQPEARNEFRQPKEQPHLTPGQKMEAARRYKKSLADIEQEFRERQSGSYVDKRSGELLPAMAEDELNRRKQEAEDAYKDELEAGGETVSRYDYRSGNPRANASNEKAPAQHKVGDEVMYQGKPHRITAIRNGKATLAPLNQ